MIHPRLPPSLSAKTPDVPPQKKCGTMPGIISAMPSPPSKSIPTSPPTKELMNPTTTAVGLKVKNTAQSTAGMESGISFWLMPWNAGTRSPRISRTPLYTMATPTANCRPVSTEKISMFWSVMVLRYADPATALQTK